MTSEIIKPKTLPLIFKKIISEEVYNLNIITQSQNLGSRVNVLHHSSPYTRGKYQGTVDQEIAQKRRHSSPERVMNQESSVLDSDIAKWP